MTAECAVCLGNYDETTKCPRTLNCGHTFCSECLTQLATANIIACPQDKKITRISRVESIMKNFALLDILREGNTHVRAPVAPLPGTLTCEVCVTTPHTASHLCIDCGEHMCDVVAGIHASQRLSKHHTLITLQDLPSNPFLSSPVPLTNCSKHNAVFCSYHTPTDTMMCEACLRSNPLLMGECVPLRVAALTVEPELRGGVLALAQREGECAQQAAEMAEVTRKLKGKAKSALELSRRTFTELREAVNSAEQRHLSEIRKWDEVCTEAMNTRIAARNSARERASTVRQRVQSALSQPIPAFQVSVARELREGLHALPEVGTGTSPCDMLSWGDLVTPMPDITAAMDAVSQLVAVRSTAGLMALIEQTPHMPQPASPPPHASTSSPAPSSSVAAGVSDTPFTPPSLETPLFAVQHHLTRPQRGVTSQRQRPRGLRQRYVDTLAGNA